MATHSSILAQRQRSLVGYSPWGRTELDTTETLDKPGQIDTVSEGMAIVNLI